jgi:ribosomal-protein-alanine N-acetyltransferase
MKSTNEQTGIPRFEPVETERLIIRPFSLEDITDRYISWLNDPENNRYSSLRHSVQTRQSCERYYCQMKESGDWFLAILRKDGPRKHIGNLRVLFDRINNVADIAIIIGEQTARGQGYAKEAWAAVLAILLTNGCAEKITAGTMDENKAMIKVALASGMHQEARLRGQLLLDGRRVDQIQFARFVEKNESKK